jgi:hypothetical protein
MPRLPASEHAVMGLANTPALECFHRGIRRFDEAGVRSRGDHGLVVDGGYVVRVTPRRGVRWSGRTLTSKNASQILGHRTSTGQNLQPGWL